MATEDFNNTTAAKPLFDRIAVADAAAELYPEVDRGADRLYGIAVDRTAGTSSPSAS